MALIRAFQKETRPGLCAQQAQAIYKPWKFAQLEAYGGYGFGKIENNHYSGWSTNKIRQWYIQPALGFNNSAHTIQGGLSTRFAFMHFNIDTAFTNDREPFSTSQVMALYNHPDQVFLEPSIYFRFGWKNMLFNTGYNWSANLSGNDFNRKKSNYSLGLTFKINTGSFNKKKIDDAD